MKYVAQISANIFGETELIFADNLNDFIESIPAAVGLASFSRLIDTVAESGYDLNEVITVYDCEIGMVINVSTEATFKLVNTNE